ncbi:zinc finger CHC2-family protein [Cellvibrio sp. BR]|nr:zinc finger CHC2-family protein [Cellvibrio sp. BR]
MLIAYDRDEAGDKAALVVAEKLNQHGIDAFRVLFPKGMDANQYADQMAPAPKALALVIRSAQWLGSGSAVPPLTTTIIDAEKPTALTVRGNKVLDGNTLVNEAKGRGWADDTKIPVVELPDNVNDDPLGPYR